MQTVKHTFPCTILADKKASKKNKKTVDNRNELVYNNFCRCERHGAKASKIHFLHYAKRGVAQLG